MKCGIGLLLYLPTQANDPHHPFKYKSKQTVAKYANPLYLQLRNVFSIYND